jgi:hypothetical protein
MKKVYYAHSLHLYNTPQEKRDVELLEKLGFQVFNPNSPEIQAEVQKRIAEGKGEYMNYFDDLIQSCDAVAYRAHVDGKIPAGVGKELAFAAVGEKPVFELPNLIKSRFLDVDETRQYLHLNGQR